MCKLSITLTALILLWFSAIAQPQPPDTLWTQLYYGVQDKGHEVIQTDDEGFVIVGETITYGAGASDVYFIKTDLLGDTLWTRTYGSSCHDRGHSVQQTDDGGYIIVGSYQEDYSEDYDVYLIKIDMHGDTMWTRTFGGPNDDVGHCVRQTIDGGYIIAGFYTYSFQNEHVFVIKTDTNGDTVWTRIFGDDAKAYSVRQTSDGDYIVVGQGRIPIVTNKLIYLLKLDSLGDTLWTEYYGVGTNDYGFEIEITNDGGYIIVGSTNPTGNPDVYLVRTDSDGNIIWAREYYTIYGQVGRSVKQTLDGGYIIAGNEGNAALTIKTDSTGNILWTDNFFEPYLSSYFESVCLTQDGGYAMTGYHSYQLYIRVWLVRYFSEFMPLNVSITPLNPPIIIPANGGTFDFNIDIANCDSVTAFFDLWTMVTFPNNRVFGPIIYMNYTINPNSFENRDRTQYIPARAPAGQYTYDAYVGNYPNNVWDEDHFDFEKLAVSDGGVIISDWANRDDCFSGEVVGEMVGTPAEFILLPAYPNPFNPETKLTFALPEAGNVSLIIYDIQGREVVRLADGFRLAGIYETTFDASGLSSGIYFARLQADGFSHTRKLLLIK